MAKRKRAKRVICKRVSMGRGKGTRGMCYKKDRKGKWRMLFVTDAEYRRRKGLSGGSTKSKKRKSRR